MDFQNNYHEFGKLEQIISQFLLKSLHVILDSRIPSLRPSDRSGEQSSTSRVRKTDKWFNLVLGDRPAVLENLNFWHRNIMDPMVIDIILVHQVPSSSSPEKFCDPTTMEASFETVIERWVVQYEAPRIVAPQIGDNSASYKKTYKKSIMLLRSLYSQMRLLPAYRIFRQLNAASQAYNFDIIYKVSSFGEPLSRAEEGLIEEYSFSPVEALPGRLCVSVTYRSTLSDFSLEPSTAMPTKIITDYVGSPNTNHLKSIPCSSGKGFRALSFRSKGVIPASLAPFDRPHSWTSGFQGAYPCMPSQPFTESSTSQRPYPMSCDSPSPLAYIYANERRNYRPLTNHKTNINDEYHQLSPPFSPLLSPSPPTYLSNGNTNSAQTRPVAIPLPTTGRSSRNFSPNLSDPSRNFLPPLSPRSTRNDPLSQESPSGIRSLRKIELSRPGEMHSGITQYGASPKLIKDSKEDSGRYSGLLSSSSSPRVGFSRSSSRVSFQDDLDDCDFSCPFDVDDVDMPGFQYSQNVDGKKGSEQSLPMGKKSQDAAVGVLVHMLRTAPPLRQDSSCYSSQTLKTNLDREVATDSGFFMPRKAVDALEELRSYKEMKDLLLSKSGSTVISKEEA